MSENIIEASNDVTPQNIPSISTNVNYNRIGANLLGKLNHKASEAIKIKNLIDTAKTRLKKEFYMKKLIKNSLEAEKIIKALEMVRLTTEQDNV